MQDSRAASLAPSVSPTATRLRTAFLALAGGTLLVASPALAGESPLAKGERLAANCFTCHGDGVANLGKIPGLVGISQDRIKAVLKDFQSGAKPSTIMVRISKGYTDDEIAVIAAYLEHSAKTKSAKK